ncbi:unnamed protein product [Prorocentrum cordatum]|uniref:Uncharacterized protein n=1 Tax=Prorocentrum cordatum TaxID=2364126 RepID=A0ABN9PMR4_9DINO|nr:unnamed protein product [Polarella glacialis]
MVSPKGFGDPSSSSSASSSSSSVGGVRDGRDTTYRVAKANCPIPKAAAAVEPVAKLVCDWRGPEGKRWCSRCRLAERASECPGSIVAAALSYNEALKQAGKDVHMLVKLLPQREADLVREMPVVMRAACGVMGSSFTAACGHPQPRRRPPSPGSPRSWRQRSLASSRCPSSR